MTAETEDDGTCGSFFLLYIHWNMINHAAGKWSISIRFTGASGAASKVPRANDFVASRDTPARFEMVVGLAEVLSTGGSSKISSRSCA